MKRLGITLALSLSLLALGACGGSEDPTAGLKASMQQDDPMVALKAMAGGATLVPTDSPGVFLSEDGKTAYATSCAALAASPYSHLGTICLTD